jgi:hypothetical protein
MHRFALAAFLLSSVSAFAATPAPTPEAPFDWSSNSASGSAVCHLTAVCGVPVLNMSFGSVGPKFAVSSQADCLQAGVDYLKKLDTHCGLMRANVTATYEDETAKVATRIVRKK